MAAILANFSEFSTQAAKSWNERQKERRAPMSRCMSGCCICARSFWSEDLTFAAFAGPDSPIQNAKSVAKLLSPNRYFDKWPVYLWDELKASSILLCDVDIGIASIFGRTHQSSQQVASFLLGSNV